MKIEVSIGEIVDKLTILDIKMSNILDPEKLRNIAKEYGYLKDVVEDELGIPTTSEEYLKLLNINKELWDIEDDIRDKERNKEFDEVFIELARAVYVTNDKRAEAKKEIRDLALDSLIQAAIYWSQTNGFTVIYSSTGIEKFVRRLSSLGFHKGDTLQTHMFYRSA